MTRSNVRELAIHLIYELDYTGEVPSTALENRLSEEYYRNLAVENDIYSDRPSKKQIVYLQQCVNGVYEAREELDALIQKYAIGWNLSRISRFTKNAMRLAIYEILNVEDVPAGVAINECIEITKKYEDPEVAKFVNGILGSFVRDNEGKQ